MTTGQKLKKALEASEKTEFEIARAMYVSPAYILSIERGKTEPDGPTKRWLEKLLGMESMALEEDEADAGANDADHADAGAIAGAGGNGVGGDAGQEP